VNGPELEIASLQVVTEISEVGDGEEELPVKCKVFRFCMAKLARKETQQLPGALYLFL
jgi:hypothetical protein